MQIPGMRGKGVRVDWSDAEMLLALDLSERLLLSATAVARALNARFLTGRSRSSVIGLLDRVNSATDTVPDLCRRPQNRDGAMPPEWWQAGLRRQAERVFEPAPPRMPKAAKWPQPAPVPRTRSFVHVPKVKPPPLPPAPRMAVPPARHGISDAVLTVARADWCPSTDLAILAAMAEGSGVFALATRLGRPPRDLTTRWHRLRVVRGLDAALGRYLTHHGDDYARALQVQA